MKYASNATIRALTILTAILMVVLGLMAFNIIPTEFITVGLFVGGFNIMGGGILLLETFVEGKRPNLQKDVGAIISLIVGLTVMISGVFMMFNKVIPTTVLGIVGAADLIVAVLLVREFAVKSA